MPINAAVYTVLTIAGIAAVDEFLIISFVKSYNQNQMAFWGFKNNDLK